MKRKQTVFGFDETAVVVNNNPETNDNKVAIEMLNDVVCILQGIEFDNPKSINLALTNLEKHMTAFEKVFINNLLHGRYQQ